MDEGNVLIDPVPMTAADLEQFDQLGGAAWIVLTNRDHEREAAFFRDRTGARIAAHRADADLFEQPPDRRLDDGEEIVLWAPSSTFGARQESGGDRPVLAGP